MVKDIYKDQNLPRAVMPKCKPRDILVGQKAVVTGGNTGIGKAIAMALGNAGADVAVNYLNDDDGAVEEMTHELKKAGRQVMGIQADVSNENEVKELFAQVTERFGTVDILVNNAGLQQGAPFEEMTLAQWQKVIDVNLTGQFLCAREAVKEFKRRGVVSEVSCAAGKILCISSVHEVIPWAGHVNYAASKGGVLLMMKSIAQEVAPFRIRVNSIAPGAVKTKINKDAWSSPEAEEELLKLIPYQRIGEPEDIGRVAIWLASDDSDYINGITLFVDGGMTLYPGFAEDG